MSESPYPLETARLDSSSPRPARLVRAKDCLRDIEVLDCGDCKDSLQASGM